MSSVNLSTLSRYALSSLLLTIVVAITLLIRHFEIAVNLSLLVMAGLAAAAWFLGRGPALFMLGLMWIVSLYLNRTNPDIPLASWAISNISVLAVFAFIILLVSGRRGYESSLRQRSELLRTTLSSIGDGVIASDTEGKITFMNPEAESLTGCSSENAGGKHLSEILAIKRESTGQSIMDIVSAVTTTGAPTVEHDDLILTSCDDVEVPIVLSAAAIRDVTGAFSGAVVVFQDITPRRESERAILESETRLQQAQKIESIGTLTGGIAHDFNNLLTAILGHTELALLKLSGNDPIRHNLVEVKKAGDRGSALTRKLLAFSRRQHLDRRVIDLNEAITNMLTFLESVIGANIAVTFRKGDVAPVFADASQIEQVIMNLTLNARDAMPTGGRLAIETHVIELDEFYARQHPDCKPGRYSQIVVSDTGVGIEPDAISRIYEPFYTTKDIDKGTGLGLSMAHGIVKQHGGHITVYSEPGRGTTFKIFLPAVEDEVAARPDVQEISTRGGSETILVADDEEALRDLSRDVLENLGYTVLMAEDGEHALKLYEENAEKIDLLLFDVVMPKIGGSEAYRRIVENAGHPVPVVFMTGYSEEILNSPYAKQGEGIDLAAVTIIQKPYTLDFLGRTVRNALDNSGN